MCVKKKTERLKAPDYWDEWLVGDDLPTLDFSPDKKINYVKAGERNVI